MDMPLTIRPAQCPEDYVAITEVFNSFSDWHHKPENMSLEDRNRNPELHFARYVAENQNQIVAVLELGHNEHSHEIGKYWVSIDVHKEFRQCGIAKQLLVVAQNHLAQLGDVAKVQTMFRSDETAALHLMDKLGFVKVWERIESRLEPSSIDFAQYAALDSSLVAAGFETKRFADLDPDTRLETLYALDTELILDVPFGQPTTITPFERWKVGFLEDKDNDPETIWIALKDGVWIGMSSLIRQPEFLMIGMTGVKRDYRGLGIAKRLKLEGVRYALAHNLEICTFNDHINTAMLNMNKAMGFVAFRSRLRFEKQVG